MRIDELDHRKHFGITEWRTPRAVDQRPRSLQIVHLSQNICPATGMLHKDFVINSSVSAWPLWRSKVFNELQEQDATLQYVFPVVAPIVKQELRGVS